MYFFFNFQIIYKYEIRKKYNSSEKHTLNIFHKNKALKNKDMKNKYACGFTLP